MSNLQEKAEEIYYEGNVPDLEMQIEAYIKGFTDCQKEYEVKRKNYIEIPDECICSCKNIEKLELVYPLPPICCNCRKFIRRSFL